MHGVGVGMWVGASLVWISMAGRRDAYLVLAHDSNTLFNSNLLAIISVLLSA